MCKHVCVHLHRGRRIIDVEHTHANEHRVYPVCMVCVCVIVCVFVCVRVLVCMCDRESVCVVIKPEMFYWPADSVHKKISGPNPLVG